MPSVARYCCCGCAASATPCSVCSDYTPQTLVVTLSGVSLCTVCNMGFNSLEWAPGYSDATINATHTITQISPTSSPCQWSNISTGYANNSIRRRTHANADCTGASNIAATGGFAVSIQRVTGLWRLQLLLRGLGGGFDNDIIFYDEQPETDVGICGEFPALFTNDNVTCYTPGPGPFPPTVVGTGGTATLTCI